MQPNVSRRQKYGIFVGLLINMAFTLISLLMV
jgi:hypothetical protein